MGYAYTTDNNSYHAYRWEGGAKEDLGTLGGTDSYAFALSEDGSIIVGGSHVAGDTQHAFRWTAATGMQDLNTLLTDAGVDMSGITLTFGRYLSADAQFIAGAANVSGEAHAFVVRYYDGTPAGLTDPLSVQQSVNDVGAARSGAMAQQHGLAMPLLGGDKPMGDDSEIGVFGQAGSGQGGGYARFVNAAGFAVLGGVSYGYEDYDTASIDNALMGALAVRYLAPGTVAWRPFVEAGGWLAPDADFEFQRTYANGAGTASGIGNTEGKVSYLFARAGSLFDMGHNGQVAISAEVGRERLDIKGYSETLSAANPFNAYVSEGTDTMSILKARAQWSAALGYGFDATLWGAAVYGFDRDTALEASVAGIGTMTALVDETVVWAEYGARVGYAISAAATFDVFVNGVSGQDGIDTRVHGGAGLRYRF